MSSRECQKLDWDNHKIQCNETGRRAEEISRALNVDPPTTVPTTAREINDALVRWIELQRPIIILSSIHALRLQSTPERCFSDVFVITLKSNFSNLVNSPTTSFLVEYAHTQSLESFFGDRSSSYRLMDEQLLVQSRDIRADGGFGIVMIAINVPQFSQSHTLPFACTKAVMPELSCMKWNSHWKQHLMDTVASGLIGLAPDV
ncbi:hypothetical protein BDQ12DRAFT_728531 [Crucibulum laeve]|uniref:Uncharacterized protein n=1 Tax=Crucibulum laeve TaxID=68775 RepID=A0A5C3LK28_9AGAR|nr:hypothetical protein BDQ12DRAFT_728531 [Crucibulum laeve]